MTHTCKDLGRHIVISIVHRERRLQSEGLGLAIVSSLACPSLDLINNARSRQVAFSESPSCTKRTLERHQKKNHRSKIRLTKKQSDSTPQLLITVPQLFFNIIKPMKIACSSTFSLTFPQLFLTQFRVVFGKNTNTSFKSTRLHAWPPTVPKSCPGRRLWVSKPC